MYYVLAAEEPTFFSGGGGVYLQKWVAGDHSGDVQHAPPAFRVIWKNAGFLSRLGKRNDFDRRRPKWQFSNHWGCAFFFDPSKTFQERPFCPRSATTIAPFNPRTPRRSRCSPAVTSPSRRAPRTRTTSLPSKMSRCRPCRPPVRGPMPACCNLISVRRADQRVAVRISGERSCPFATHNVRLLRETQGALLTRPPLSPQYVFVAL